MDAALDQPPDDPGGIPLVDLLSVVVALDEADAAAPSDVDGRDDDHGRDGAAGLRSPTEAATRLA